MEAARAVELGRLMSSPTRRIARLLPLALVLTLPAVAQASIPAPASLPTPSLAVSIFSENPPLFAELPFGEECLTGPCLANPGVGAGQPRKFTGKERDAETGLDYFGARYYGSKIGRFTTVDPVYTWKENLADPQRWNRYAYSLNNPLRYVDPNGKWPTGVHNEIIQTAFPGLTTGQIQLLQQASSDTDYVISFNGKSPQDPANSYIHSMSDGVHNQDPREAQQRAEAFVNANEQDARAWQAIYESAGGQGLSANALYHLGIALHTVSDATSPAHAGYQPWNGTDSARNKGAGLAHLNSERKPSPEQLANAVRAERDAFRSTFGDARYREATTEKQ